MHQNSHFGFAPFLNILPENAVKTPIESVFLLLEQHFGAEFYKAFEAEKYPAPVHNNTDVQWIKTANTVGVNVRTIGSFWSLIPYSMTLPAAQNAIHLLPIFEPGVVSSLYGPTSWNINPEFYNAELGALFPNLNTVEAQLSFVVRLLHLMGKSVGLDIVPHVDRYAEQVLANPSLFEWIQRNDMEITNHSDDLVLEVRALLFDFLKNRGSAVPGLTLPDAETDFFDVLPESTRVKMMFGEKYDYHGRLEKRVQMVDLLYAEGLETLPATMGPPYRGIEVNPDPEAKIVDSAGRIWRDYRITKPQKFSRVFGPLARFKLYESKDKNINWELDFDRPFVPAWDYACKHYHAIQQEFDFDFMRGDMSHVQMRPDGTPENPGPYYDLLGAIKAAVLPEKPYFGYFAESFLAPPGEMAYGDECDHLEASEADTTLGDLQSEPVGTPHFMREFARYDALLRSRRCAPNFTIMTADKDDPRFDAFYLNGNESRYFIALFLTDMPSYMGLGFECRDPHPVPAPNEHYTKLYVFQEHEGAKSTKGPFVWGKNSALFDRLSLIKKLSQEIGQTIADKKTKWLVPPGQTGVACWTQAEQPQYVFAANLNQAGEGQPAEISFPPGQWKVIFALNQPEEMAAELLSGKGFLLPGACVVWEKMN